MISLDIAMVIAAGSYCRQCRSKYNLFASPLAQELPPIMVSHEARPPRVIEGLTVAGLAHEAREDLEVAHRPCLAHESTAEETLQATDDALLKFQD